MKNIYSITAFLFVFLLTQKMVPVLIPLGEFSGIGAGDLLRWIFGFRSFVVSFVMGCLILLVCGWPLCRLSVLMSILFGGLSSLACGFFLFPYDVFDLGLVSQEYFAFSILVWLIILLIPWAMVITRKADVGRKSP